MIEVLGCLTLASAIAVGAAVAFFPFRRSGSPGRTSAWFASSVAVACSPCLIASSAKPARLAASLAAITLLVKLYDFYRSAELARRLGFREYLAHLPNGFWLVLRKEPGGVPAALDVKRLTWTVPTATASVFLAGALWYWDWSSLPFALEHAAKVSAVVLAVVQTTNAAASAYRVLGGKALKPMANPLAARTPAEFWRRWNRPAQQFFHEYAFAPAGGPNRALVATLATFGTSGLVHEYVFGAATGQFQGCQFVFFGIQGCAAAMTRCIRPSRRAVPLWVAGTALFNLAASVLFFRSIDAVVPFYCPRVP